MRVSSQPICCCWKQPGSQNAKTRAIQAAHSSPWMRLRRKLYLDGIGSHCCHHRLILSAYLWMEAMMQQCSERARDLIMPRAPGACVSQRALQGKHCVFSPKALADDSHLQLQPIPVPAPEPAECEASHCVNHTATSRRLILSRKYYNVNS